ncbi:MAG: hypothetical protein Q7U04_02905, partial [Bacteriovorax sp.]|nr:hypothetical protein [Bacteriovorax sp.]
LFGLKDFFQALSIKISEELEQKLGDDFSLFIYSQTQGKRLGLVIKIITQEGLADLLSSQEKTMEEDFKNLFILSGKEGKALTPYFKNASATKGYQGPDFRYQTLSKDDLGICYSIFNDYFVFTSSWASMEEVLKRL